MCKWGITATQVKLAHPNGKGRTHVPVDPCIAHLVQGLNDAGLQTVASCCGHGKRPGNIMLEDGQELVIAPDYDTAREIDRLFPSDIQGGTWMVPALID